MGILLVLNRKTKNEGTFWASTNLQSVDENDQKGSNLPDPKADEAKALVTTVGEDRGLGSLMKTMMDSSVPC